MKKIAVLALTLVMSAGLIAGCGSTGGDATSSTDNDTNSSAEQTAAPATYDTTVFKVSVPAGWTAVDYPDVFSSEEGATDPEYVYLIKGGTAVEDIFNCPYVLIHYAPNTGLMKMDFSTMYDDYKELSPSTIGDYTWEGFSFTSADYVESMHTVEIGEGYAQITICNPPDTASPVTIDDNDVNTILSGFAPD